jgi:hypothetical protein
MDRSAATLERSDRGLAQVEGLAQAAQRYLELASENARLERRRIELEIQRLERG